MAKKKARAPAKASGNFWASLAGNKLVMVGLLGVVAIAALVLMLLQVM
ncbi:hypothetical protein HZA97_00550 [Candidatus Woesearchaeota archaeon]|nr:hypothetical protein [Candidatus Woesearchaeota archaeon]